MTRIPESRLETIHLLETELERQHVQAAEAAAIATPSTKHGADLTVPYNDLKNGEFHPGRALPTIVFSLLVGSVVLASVLYRIFFIIRGEIVWQQAFTKRKYANGNVATGPTVPMTTESPLDDKRNGRRTPPLSPTRNLDTDDPQTNGHQNAVSNPSVSPKTKSELSPQCYKRAPGSSPTVV